MPAMKQLRAVAPELDCRICAIAEGQHEYLTIYGGFLTNPSYPAPNGYNTALLAFRLDEEHRKAIAEGADIYVSLLTFGNPMQPIIVQVGKESASATYNVRAQRGGG